MARSAEFRANEDAQIYQHLRDAFLDVLSPDVFPTLTDPQGHQRTIRLGDFSLEIVVSHRGRGLEDLYGVDVFYNFDNRKALAFQHKKRAIDGTLFFGAEEQEQRDKIQQLCNMCRPRPRVRDRAAYLRSDCASVYVVGEARTAVRHVVSACQLDRYRTSFPRGAPVDASQFPHPCNIRSVDQMFVQCVVGRVLDQREARLSLASIRDASLAQPNLVIDATLRRRSYDLFSPK
jgi:hypothetical protein